MPDDEFFLRRRNIHFYMLYGVYNHFKGGRGIPLEWLSAYIQNRYQHVKIENVKLEAVEIRYLLRVQYLDRSCFFLRKQLKLSNPKCLSCSICIDSETMTDFDIDSYQMHNSCI